MAAEILPMIRGISPYPAVFVAAMVVALLIYVLFYYIDATSNWRPATANNVANKQVVEYQLSSHPGEIVGELDRALQRKLGEEKKFPNRFIFARMPIST
jgi:hypothetical protein